MPIPGTGQSQGQDPNNPYQYGLGAQRPTGSAYDFGPNSGDVVRNGNWVNNPSSDPDVQGLQGIYNLQSRRNPGTSNADQQGLIDMYSGRIGLKNSLGQNIANNSGLESSAEGNLRAGINAGLGQGLRNTRENFNNRGLLYSGARVGGEQSVRSQAAGELASGLAGTKQDYANQKTLAQNAYASVDLANQQQTLDMANSAFDTANQNSIARMQAAQQLSGGIGAAAGTVAGYYNRTPGQLPPGQPPQQLSDAEIQSENPSGLVNYNPNQAYYNPYQNLATSSVA